MEFDTDRMTVAELKEALAIRKLSTKGKKSDLKQRLEEDIIREKGSQQPIQPQEKQKTTVVPDWLSWD